MARWIAAGLLVAGLVLVAEMWPDIQRYRRIRDM